MRRFSFIVFLLVIWLATCHGPEPKTPSPTNVPVQMEVSVTPTAISPAVGRLPAAPFDARILSYPLPE